MVNLGLLPFYVCNILDVKNTSDALSRLEDFEKKELPFDQVIGLTDNPSVTRLSAISESGMYALVLSSRKSEAKPFRIWVTSEVLPSIRKTGSYAVEPTKPKTALELAKEQVKLLEAIEIQQKMIESLEADTLRQAEAIDELFDYSSIIRIAKFNNVCESNFAWRKLKATSEVMELEIKKVPDPNWLTKNLYAHDAWRVAYPDAKLPETTTLVIHN